MFFIDLDNFQALNDTLGHGVGDLLLQIVGSRFSGSVRKVDTVSRFGGDEFVVILDNLHIDRLEEEELAKAISNKILASFTLSFKLANHEHYITPSIGVTLFGEDVANADGVLKRADLAMYQAKSSGKNMVRFLILKCKRSLLLGLRWRKTYVRRFKIMSSYFTINLKLI
ncbi:MAG: GGDEF domain-containing protein [Methylophilaceae bacterium]|nr:GGDEF domain-containing protein [Methylophilaceae bacterium]